MHKAAVPHLAYPFRVDADGSVAVVEQDTLDEVAQHAQVVLLTRRGQRPVVPEFGIPDPLFEEAPLDLADVEAAISRYDPRGRVVVEDRTLLVTLLEKAGLDRRVVVEVRA